MTQSDTTASLADLAHCFHERSFKSPTACLQCTKMIWGLKAKGFECKLVDCKFKAHSACVQHVSGDCIYLFFLNHRVQKTQSAISTSSSLSGVAENNGSLRPMPRPRKRQSIDHADNIPIAPPINSPPSNLAPLIASPSSSLASQISNTAQVYAYALQWVFKKHTPPLNVVSTLPMNLVRMIHRFDPLRESINAIFDVLFWRFPLLTVLWIICWTVTCFYPVVLAFVPHCILFAWIVRNYYARVYNKVNKITPERSPDYSANLRCIQNIVGSFVMLYDLFDQDLAIWVNWTSPSRTLRIFWMSLVSVPLTGMLITIIPLRVVIWWCGLSTFFMTTGFSQAFLVVMIDWMRRRWRSGH